MLQSTPQTKQQIWITHWFDARYCVYDGELVNAIKAYKKAFTTAYFKAGAVQKLIIEEALVVTACIANPDNVFLRKLRQAQILLNYEPGHALTEKQNVHKNWFEQHEVEFWASKFESYFPPVGWFFEGRSKQIKARSSRLVLLEDLKKIKPDYRNPNRKIDLQKKVGVNRKVPQLIFFVEHKDLKTCKKLLASDASVSHTADDNTSAIYAALRHVDLTDPQVHKPDDRFFKTLFFPSFVGAFMRFDGIGVEVIA